ncbi:hypothetical protein SBOR_9132 [Sclerotinia borealis F-4128]|uniref:Uncharacterized protein n=1 Tax=Sclerotinia borealis (strain F-4128) TaxID=1432307 RepID=W9C446_SCLBF|nr:hypothetical protein SBOR_9132 [Sclerotinia borealis F-4128]
MRVVTGNGSADAIVIDNHAAGAKYPHHAYDHRLCATPSIIQVEAYARINGVLKYFKDSVLYLGQFFKDPRSLLKVMREIGTTPGGVEHQEQPTFSHPSTTGLSSELGFCCKRE